jgi:hypothetical protein
MHGSLDTYPVNGLIVGIHKGELLQPATCGMLAGSWERVSGLCSFTLLDPNRIVLLAIY